MSFQDYPLDPADVTTIGAGVFIGPDMARDKVRPALQQLAADGRAVYDFAASQSDATLTAAQAIIGPTYASAAAGLAATTSGQSFAVNPGTGIISIYRNESGVAVAQRDLGTTAYNDARFVTKDGSGNVSIAGTLGIGSNVNVGGAVSAAVSSGSTSPVAGTSNLGALPSASFTNNGTGSTVLGIASSIANGGNNTSSYHLAGITQGVAIKYLYGDGSTSYTSDIHTKKRIKPVRGGYAVEWAKIRFVKFDKRAPDEIDLNTPAVELLWKDGDPEPGMIGVLSQDIKAIWPSAVIPAVHNLDGSLDEPDNPTPKVLQLNDGIIYGPIMGIVVQELIARIAALEAKSAAL